MTLAIKLFFISTFLFGVMSLSSYVEENTTGLKNLVASVVSIMCIMGFFGVLASIMFCWYFGIPYYM